LLLVGISPPRQHQDLHHQGSVTTPSNDTQKASGQLSDIAARVSQFVVGCILALFARIFAVPAPAAAGSCHEPGAVLDPDP
jgi:hypothetical protein